MPVIAPGASYKQHPATVKPELVISNTDDSKQAQVYISIESNMRPGLGPLFAVIEPGDTYRNSSYADGRYGVIVRSVTYVNNGKTPVSVPD